MKWLAAIAFLFVCSTLGVYVKYSSDINSGVNKKTYINVGKGDGFYRVLQNLSREQSGVPVKSLRFYLKSKGFEKSLKMGEYEFEAGTPYVSIIKDLVSGKVISYKVTVPEGYNLFEIASLFKAKKIINSREDFVKYALNGQKASQILGYKVESFEGYLFPATYDLTKSMSIKNIIELMVQTFQREFDKVSQPTKAVEGMTKHDLVTLASVVEKETGAAHERPRIASVFFNRLRKRMKLQSDPTTIYGEWLISGERLKNIRTKHLKKSTPYNTYTVRALPLGPISNPGSHALKSIFNPDTSPYLYFVSKNDGTHYFSKSYKEHQRAVRDYQLKRSARKGKSWRDLKKTVN